MAFATAFGSKLEPNWNSSFNCRYSRTLPILIHFIYFKIFRFCPWLSLLSHDRKCYSLHWWIFTFTWPHYLWHLFSGSLDCYSILILSWQWIADFGITVTFVLLFWLPVENKHFNELAALQCWNGSSQGWVHKCFHYCMLTYCCTHSTGLIFDCYWRWKCRLADMFIWSSAHLIANFENKKALWSHFNDVTPAAVSLMLHMCPNRSYQDFGARSRYIRQGSLNASHSILRDAIAYTCTGYQLLVPTSLYVNCLV